MPPPPIIQELVDHYRRNAKSYKALNETEVRLQFIDPLFEALGWDVHNKNRYAEAYKDVVHEYSLKGATTVEAPDYCFQVGGNRKFFVEAKRPSVAINTDVSPAYQLRSYGWTSKLPISILTNFASFAVYDCRKEPKPGDKASTSRIDLISYEEYVDRWDDIFSRFSRDAVYKGSFDQYGETTKGKRGTAEVDDAFLSDIEAWRSQLAGDIARQNLLLTQREINFAVQRTIDRIIFLRICEDRGIEPYGQLEKVCQGSGIYKRLCVIYERADEKYNSGLFHFSVEKGRDEEPDYLTRGLTITDGKLKQIIKRLYYPESPYRFSHFPPDVLGQVYEQFLGSTIRLTAGHQVRIELKPEVKKAGGVYYTPAYVVRYITEQTIAAAVRGKTPKTVSNLRILDPACGSGSFLIVAYQYLLDWHRQWYIDDGPDKNKSVLYQVGSIEWRLTTQERRRILLNNIYGVDIDSQAVEVTKLSLLLKVLEGESEETLGNNMRLFHERALPDLGKNIKCGNSLIAPDYFKTRQMLLVDEDTRLRINAFEWNGKDGFSTIMGKGGFDVVMGNPPYLYSAAKEDPEYFELRYAHAQYQTDYYVYFIEKALALARRNGLVSFIVSDSWLNSEKFSRIRNFMLEQRISLIAVFNYPVFKKVTLENSIFVLQKGVSPAPIPIVRFRNPLFAEEVNRIAPQDAIERNLIDPSNSAGTLRLIQFIETKTRPLVSYVRLNRGIHAYRTDGYGASAFEKGPQTARDKAEQSYHADRAIDETYYPEIKGKHVGKYTVKSSGLYLSYGPWLAESREASFFEKPRIVLRKVLGKRLSGSFVTGNVAIDQSLYIAIAKEGGSDMLKHILAIMLSPIGAWYLRHKYSIFDTLYPWYTTKQLAQFPMKPLSKDLVEHVNSFLSLQGELAKARTDQTRLSLKRQMSYVESELDSTVYKLYGLNKDDIALIESEVN